MVLFGIGKKVAGRALLSKNYGCGIYQTLSGKSGPKEG